MSTNLWLFKRGKLQIKFTKLTLRYTPEKTGPIREH